MNPPHALFGNPADFAIEARVEPGLESPSSVWGRMCVWCRGVPLGDMGEPFCALYPAYRHFEDLPLYLDQLWAGDLNGMDDLSVWNLLDGLLYSHHGDVPVPDERTAEECRRDWQRWGRFDFLTNWDESFDRNKAFLLCPPGGRARILHRHIPDTGLNCFEVSREAIGAAAAGFTRWFEEQAARLSERVK